MNLQRIIFVFCVILTTSKIAYCQQTTLDSKLVAVTMRSIGNKILSSTGDTTTRVTPIEVVSNTYTINFEKQIPLQYDSIVPIIKSELAILGISKYIAEIKDCQTNDVILSFYIGYQQDSLLPCLGRDTPVSCYKIEIDLSQKSIANSKPLYSILAVGLCLILVFRFTKPMWSNQNKSTDEAIPVQQNRNEERFISFGRYKFNRDTNQLQLEDELVELTDNESVLLSLFLGDPYQALTREQLLEEIWGNKGVLVVSRNIDVLVSKLRKKLADDDSVKIANVHGVGYKLEY